REDSWRFVEIRESILLSLLCDLCLFAIFELNQCDARARRPSHGQGTRRALEVPSAHFVQCRPLTCRTRSRGGSESCRGVLIVPARAAPSSFLSLSSRQPRPS